MYRVTLLVRCVCVCVYVCVCVCVCVCDVWHPRVMVLVVMWFLWRQVWPRAAAVAERLWSDYASTQSTTAATNRLAYHRCRMVARGINASPIGPGFCPNNVV